MCVEARKLNNTHRKRKLAGLCVGCGLAPPLSGVFHCCKCSDVRKFRKRAKRLGSKIDGVCVKCGWQPATPGKTLCESCRKSRTVARERLAQSGRCYWCTAPAAPGYRSCLDCHTKHSEQRRVRYHARKTRVLMHYSKGSMACVCCGEVIPQFLTLDHVAGNGSEHRKQLAGTRTSRSAGSDCVYRWVEKHGYPDGFQVLCINCNLGRFLNGGVCPHRSKPDPRQLTLF